MAELPPKLREKLEARRREGNLRTLTNPGSGVDFYSNDYLGLAREILAEPESASFPDGSGGSRLISGNHPLYGTLEQKLCEVHRAQAALVYNSGYDANLGLLSAVARRVDYIFYDQSVHASIRDGLALSRARSYSYRHNSPEDLEKRVQAVLKKGIPKGSEVYVVTESVFSMEGDSPDLRALAAYCSKNGFRLILDEAHAVGVLGRDGGGAVVRDGLEQEVFARIVTFGKAVGRHGAAVLCDPSMRDYLINFSRSLIYSTALPPRTLSGILHGYALMTGDAGMQRRKELERNIDEFLRGAEAMGIRGRFLPASGAIQSCLVGDNHEADRLGRALNERGYLVKPIRYPTVPRGRECIRFCLHSFNTSGEIQEVLSILAEEIQAP